MEINLEARGCCGRSPVPLPDLTLCLPLFVKSEDEHSLDLPTILHIVKSNASCPQLLVLGFCNNGIGIGLGDVMGLLDIFFSHLAPPYTGYRRCQTSSNLSIEPLILNLPPRLYQNQFQLLDFTSSIEVHI